MRKISASSYLKCLLHSDDFRNDSDVLWIVSSEEMRRQASAWLDQHGFAEHRQRFYLAPANQAAENHELLLLIEERKPRHIIVATTDGAEKLSLYLRDYLLFRPRIHCLGAGLACLTGTERTIPEWIESARLGWLFRLAVQPRMIIPRLAITLVLLRMLVRYRSEEPALRPRWADV